MKIEYFHYLIMLKKAGSINKSAALLYTSPQNVSRILKVIEDELGVELVKRNLTGVEFTKAGLEAVLLGEKILGLMEEYRLQFQEKNVVAGELNIYATKIQSTLFMDDIVTKFSVLHPKIKIKFIENDLWVCLHKLKTVPNSVGLFPVLEETDLSDWDGMQLMKINSERIAVIVDKNTSFGKYKNVSYDFLKGKKCVIHARNDYEDGFWSKILYQYVKNAAEIFVASNGYLFYNKILEEQYIGLGSEKTSYLSESMQKEAIRGRTAIIPIIDEYSTYSNCLVVPNDLVKNEAVGCLKEFLEGYQEYDR